MKVYLFDTANGLFSGEDYYDQKDLSEEEGMTTTPPPGRVSGTVPVFDLSIRGWKLVPVDFFGREV